MADRIEQEASYSRQEVRDMLVGISDKEQQLNALLGLLVATTRLIQERAGDETADAYLLHTRFRCLGRGSRDLGGAQ